MVRRPKKVDRTTTEIVSLSQGCPSRSGGKSPKSGHLRSQTYLTKKKRYYKGVIAGTGGDDEVCIKKHKEITYKEYLKLRKESYASSIAYLDYRISRLRYLVGAGYSPADYMTAKADKFEELRRKIIKKFNK